MGKLRNGDDGVTINEFTASTRATKNSPHDVVTWDPHAIRGVTMDGHQVFSGDTTVVRSVNVSIGGVSFECDPSMLDVLADKDARQSLVMRSLEAQAEKDQLEASRHEWVEDEDKRTASGAAWQCTRCKGWVVGPTNLERPAGGCIGREPNEQEKRQQDAQVALQELGRRLQAIHDLAREALQNGALPINVMGAVDLGSSFGALAKLIPEVVAADAELDTPSPEVQPALASAVPPKKGN